MSYLISVIVPAYNVERYIERCLDSICKQTYKAIEIIVINDGSTDETGKLIEKFAKLDSRIVAIHKENGGVTRARLEGVKKAIGDYIGFVDSDDYIEPDMYERLLSNAIKFDAQISHCGYKMCFTDGRIHYFHNSGYLIKQDRITSLKELLSGIRIEPGLCNKLFHKSLMQKLLKDEVMDTNLKNNEDLLMNFYLFSSADATVFDDWCPYHYIVRDGSASRTKINKNLIFDPIKVKQLILSKANDDIRKEAECAYINTCINSYNTLLFEGSEYKEDLLKIRNLLREKQKSFGLIGSKRKVMALLIIKAPILYVPIYRVYAKCFQKNMYS